jgi:DNA polymerase-4
VCRTVTLRLRFADFTRVTRSRTLVEATMDTRPLLTMARGLLAAARPLIDANGLTLIGVALSNLDNKGAIQLVLPFTDHDPAALDSAVDTVRDRFGSASITRAALLRIGEGTAVPLLPD